MCKVRLYNSKIIRNREKKEKSNTLIYRIIILTLWLHYSWTGERGFTRENTNVPISKWSGDPLDFRIIRVYVRSLEGVRNSLKRGTQEKSRDGYDKTATRLY